MTTPELEALQRTKILGFHFKDSPCFQKNVKVIAMHNELRPNLEFSS
jgi:hypothetical protein